MRTMIAEIRSTRSRFSHPGTASIEEKVSAAADSKGRAVWRALCIVEADSTAKKELLCPAGDVLKLMRATGGGNLAIPSVELHLPWFCSDSRAIFHVRNVSTIDQIIRSMRPMVWQ
jgi:hypothetical protein